MSIDNASITSSGWYTDPSDPTQDRYWDGREWTEHRAAAPLTSRQPPKQGLSTGLRIMLGAIVGFVGLVMAGAVALGVRVGTTQANDADLVKQADSHMITANEDMLAIQRNPDDRAAKAADMKVQARAMHKLASQLSRPEMRTLVTAASNDYADLANAIGRSDRARVLAISERMNADARRFNDLLVS